MTRQRIAISDNQIFFRFSILRRSIDLSIPIQLW